MHGYMGYCNSDEIHDVHGIFIVNDKTKIQGYTQESWGGTQLETRLLYNCTFSWISVSNWAK